MEDGEALGLAAHRMSLEAQPCSQPRPQPRSELVKGWGAETS